MEKKYVLTEETCVIGGKTLYRIRAEKNFNNIKKGDLGGFVEKETNLSHEGDAWIFDNAYVFGNAYIFDNAYVLDNARVHGNAHIFGNACVYGDSHVYNNAYVYGDAHVCGDARVYGDAHICEHARVNDKVWIYSNACVSGNAYIYGSASIYGNACISENVCIFDYSCVYGNAHIYGDARIYDRACVYGDAYIEGNAHIFENARVCGDALVYGEARIGEHAKVQFSRLKTDLKEDLKASLRCQCNLISEDGKVIAYKLVRKDLRSLHDINFIYKIGEYAVCKNPKEDNSSCSAGLHFSNLTYWDNKCGERLENLVYLKAEIDLEDIITIQEGKIRCRKAKILNKIEIK